MQPAQWCFMVVFRQKQPFNPRTVGFTLVEMLVTMGIMFLLLALALPAIQQARLAIAKIQCLGNLKQIGLALHGYQDVHGSFPPGFRSPGPTKPFSNMGWQPPILPFLEQNTLWNQTVEDYASQPGNISMPPHRGFGTLVKAFACPVDDRLFYLDYSRHGLRPALTSYLGVLGTAVNQNDGVLFKDSNIRILDVVDGTSNTIMVGERPPSPDRWFGWWYGGNGQRATGSTDMLLGGAEINLRSVPETIPCPNGPFRFTQGSLNHYCDIFHFWSLHEGGAHFLMVDGSAKFLGYEASNLLPHLTTRAGGELGPQL